MRKMGVISRHSGAVGPSSEGHLRHRNGRQLLDTGALNIYEYWLKHIDGETRWLGCVRWFLMLTERWII